VFVSTGFNSHTRSKGRETAKVRTDHSGKRRSLEELRLDLPLHTLPDTPWRDRRRRETENWPPGAVPKSEKAHSKRSGGKENGQRKRGENVKRNGTGGLTDVGEKD